MERETRAGGELAGADQPSSRAQPVEHHEPTQPPRRRSTVREPAPVVTQQPVAPGPGSPVHTNTAEPERTPPEPETLAPAAAEEQERSTETEANDRPRRTGWWARRFAGKR